MVRGRISDGGHHSPRSHGERLARLLDEDPDRITNGISLWEASLAIARIGSVDAEQGWQDVERYRQSLGLAVLPIGAAETAEAARAHRRYGKGTGHPARLNMGDCFSYACARTNEARLLYKGDDFIHTDMA